MERPWLKFWTRDYLDHKELRRCSARARALWPDLLCLMNEGSPHGFLSDKVGPLDLEFIASRTVTPLSDVKKALEELLEKHVLAVENGVYFSRKMVEDEKLRQKRADGGRRSLSNPNVPRTKDIHGSKDILDSTRKDILDSTKKDIHSGSPLLANIVNGSRTIPIEYSLLSSGKEGSGEETEEWDDKDKSCRYWSQLWYSRHPKKKNRVLVEHVVSELVCRDDWVSLSQTIDQAHAVMCQDENWTKQRGQFAPPLDQWLLDRGWTGVVATPYPSIYTKFEDD